MTKRAELILISGYKFRVDAGSGSLEDLNWLLARGYEVMAKGYSGRRVVRLANMVTNWVLDPAWSERSFVWVNEPPTDYIRPLQRMIVRYHRQDGTFAHGVLICSLSAEQALTVLKRPRSQAADSGAVLATSVDFYDQRGGGIETSFKDHKQGLGLKKRNKKRFEAQHMLLLPGSLAHNVVIWAHRWLSCPQIQHHGILRMVCDVFHVSGMLRIEPLVLLLRLF